MCVQGISCGCHVIQVGQTDGNCRNIIIGIKDEERLGYSYNTVITNCCRSANFMMPFCYCSLSFGVAYLFN